MSVFRENVDDRLSASIGTYIELENIGEEKSRSDKYVPTLLCLVIAYPSTGDSSLLLYFSGICDSAIVFVRPKNAPVMRASFYAT